MAMLKRNMSLYMVTLIATPVSYVLLRLGVVPSLTSYRARMDARRLRSYAMFIRSFP